VQVVYCKFGKSWAGTRAGLPLAAADLRAP
jgi:hypothetical protein